MYNHKDGVRFRKVNYDDLDQLMALKEESWWGTHKTLICNHHDQVKWFENLSDNQIVMIAYVDIEDDNGHVRHPNIGVSLYDVDWISRVCDLSGSIYKKHRGSDHVKPAFSGGLDFAFEMLGMEKVNAEVVEYNLPAIKLEMEHLGFKYEGCRRSSVVKCGERFDSILLGMTREEWRNCDRVKSYEGFCNKDFDMVPDKLGKIRLKVGGLVTTQACQDVDSESQ